MRLECESANKGSGWSQVVLSLSPGPRLPLFYKTRGAATHNLEFEHCFIFQLAHSGSKSHSFGAIASFSRFLSGKRRKNFTDLWKTMEILSLAHCAHRQMGRQQSIQRTMHFRRLNWDPSGLKLSQYGAELADLRQMSFVYTKKNASHPKYLQSGFVLKTREESCVSAISKLSDYIPAKSSTLNAT